MFRHVQAGTGSMCATDCYKAMFSSAFPKPRPLTVPFPLLKKSSSKVQRKGFLGGQGEKRKDVQNKVGKCLRGEDPKVSKVETKVGPSKLFFPWFWSLSSCRVDPLRVTLDWLWSRNRTGENRTGDPTIWVETFVGTSVDLRGTFRGSFCGKSLKLWRPAWATRPEIPEKIK